MDSLPATGTPLMQINHQNVAKPSKPTNGRCFIDSSESEGSKCSQSSSDLSEPSTSEVSSCGSNEDSDSKTSAIFNSESNTWDEKSATFLRALLPWMQKSRRAPSRGVGDKVGGTLALIQHSRPPNLPMKCPSEDRRHRKQYHSILEAARKRALREESARQQYREDQRKREERLAVDSSIWQSDILPRFESLKNTKKVRDLWWCGLPPSIRGKVWKLGISNDLNIEPSHYNIYLERVYDNPISECLKAIKLDVSRTFPNLGVFQDGGPLFEALEGVLAAYTVYRSDIGYVQGMSFIGAILTLNMEPNDAFACFANLLNKPYHYAAFTLNQKQINVYYNVFSSALAQKIPKIHLHFSSTGLSPDLYLLDWLYTIYAKAMPLDVACRIWDVFVRDGDEFLFRTALGILYMYQEELLLMDFVRCAQFLTKLPENLEVAVLFSCIARMSTTIGTCTFDEMISQLS